jgi:hypothetical protein
MAIGLSDSYRWVLSETEASWSAPCVHWEEIPIVSGLDGSERQVDGLTYNDWIWWN